jgi:hypothetical protein
VSGADGIAAFHAVFVPAMKREERRSLEVHRAIATRLAANTDEIVARARRNLAKLSKQSPEASAHGRACVAPREQGRR